MTPGLDALGLEAHTTSSAFGRLHYYASRERPSDEAVLFLHGFGSSGKAWLPVIAAARQKNYLRDRGVIVVDLPGLGRSENRLGHLNAETVGQELLKLVAGLGYRRVRIAGHSMGGFLALDMAVRFPDQISSIHVVSGSYFTLLGMVNRPATTAFRAPHIALFYWFLMHFGHASFRHGAKNGDGYDADQLWGSIKIPVFGAFGARDRLVTPRDMQRLQQLLPKAHLKLIPRAGHLSLRSHPEAVADALFSSLS